MKWWWNPLRKRAWLRQEDAYMAARYDLFWKASSDPMGHSARLLAAEALKPEGWTREIEGRRWNSWNPRRGRWTA